MARMTPLLVASCILAGFLFSSCGSGARPAGGSSVAGGAATTPAPTRPAERLVWRSRPVPETVGQLEAIVCPNARTCIAVGQTQEHRGAIVRTSDGGSTWSLVLTLEDATDIFGVTCTTLSHCIAGGYGIVPSGILLVSNDGGVTWERRAVPAGTAPGAMSCSGAPSCMAIGSVGIADAVFSSTDGASAGQSTTIAAPGPQDAVFLSTDGGLRWSHVQDPFTNVAVLGGVFCTVGPRCFVSATGKNYVGDVAVTDDLGKTWAHVQRIPYGTSLGSGACAGADRCWVTAGTRIYATQDGGASWNPQPLPPWQSTLGLNAIACVSASVCTAAGGDAILATGDGGLSWHAQLLPSTVNYLYAIVCPTARHCIAVGGGGNTPVIVAGDRR